MTKKLNLLREQYEAELNRSS